MASSHRLWKSAKSKIDSTIANPDAAFAGLQYLLLEKKTVLTNNLSGIDGVICGNYRTTTSATRKRAALANDYSDIDGVNFGGYRTRHLLLRRRIALVNDLSGIDE